jgi:hypothetical protein
MLIGRKLLAGKAVTAFCFSTTEVLISDPLSLPGRGRGPEFAGPPAARSHSAYLTAMGVPIAVSLVATGCILPKPFDVTEAAGMPCCVRYSRTASPRCSESC